MSIAGLRRFLDQETPPIQERCDLCSTPLGHEHQHLVHVTERSLQCACTACAFLFDNPGAGSGEYRRVPDRYLVDPGFELSASQWEELQIPVRMAFFFRNSVQDKIIACYPSPAGATESELDLSSWTDGVGAGKLAAELTPDVEALLVRRNERDSGSGECLLVPIDACYKLVGIVRMHWKGFDGGSDAWEAIDAFFDEIRDRSFELES